MTILTAQIADSLFDEKHLFLASSDLDEVVEGCTKALRPHRLVMRGAVGSLDTRLHHLPVGPLSLNRLHYGADVTVAPATPEEDNFLVALPLSGKARFSYGAESCDLAPGRGAIVGPYHQFRFDIDSSFDQLVLRLDRRRVEAISASLVGANTASPVHFKLSLTAMPEFWHKLLETAASLSLCGGIHAQARLFAHLEEMLIEALLLSQPNSRSSAIADASRRHVPTAQIRRAMEYMREHLSEPIRLFDVAKQVGMSLRSLQAGFRRDAGVTPSQWLKSLRLERAYSQLLHAPPGSVSVTEVAFQLGFFHLGEFAAQFKAKFGQKPSEVLAKRCH